MMRITENRQPMQVGVCEVVQERVQQSQRGKMRAGREPLNRKQE